jgi:hypothetical protein
MNGANLEPIRMTAVGTTRTSAHVRAMSAVEGNPDIRRVAPKGPRTQRGLTRWPAGKVHMELLPEASLCNVTHNDFAVVADEKGTLPSWKAIKAALQSFDRAGLAIGQPAGLAELSTFYCEEALSFVESCAFEDERYFVALIRMYDRAVQCVLDLPAVERLTFAERLGRLRSRARPFGWSVYDEFSSIWHEGGLHECYGD